MTKGRTSRQRILRSALEVSSEQGVTGVSLGQLAAKSSMSKSGLFAHFASKEALQIELLDAAEAALVDHVIAPCASLPTGLGKLRTIVDRWLGWSSAAGLPGGCPLYAAAFEVDDAPGPVRDHLMRQHRIWIDQLRSLIVDAIGQGDLPADSDPDQIVWQLEGIYLAHHLASRFVESADADDRARRAVDALLSPDHAPRNDQR